jgi:hypothetical protein
MQAGLYGGPAGSLASALAARASPRALDRGTRAASAEERELVLAAVARWQEE